MGEQNRNNNSHSYVLSSCSPYSISSSAIASICTITPNTVVSTPTTTITAPILLIKSISFLFPLPIHPLCSLVCFACYHAERIAKHHKQCTQYHKDIDHYPHIVLLLRSLRLSRFTGMREPTRYASLTNGWYSAQCEFVLRATNTSATATHGCLRHFPPYVAPFLPHTGEHPRPYPKQRPSVCLRVCWYQDSATDAPINSHGCYPHGISVLCIALS